MLDRPDVKPIALDRVSRLPWVAPPAGYIILIQDVAYGSRYKIARHQQLDRHLIRRGADFPFETRVVRIWKANEAAAAERDLHDEIAAGTSIGEWFDLYQSPTAASAPASQYESVSLRDLAQHSGDAESLLQDAKIVGAGSHVSTPQASAGGLVSRRQTSAPAAGRAATTRRPRRARWAFALGLFILASFFVAERSNDFRRAIDSIVDPSSRPAISNRAAAPTTVTGRTRSRSALPTPRVEGRGEVFYTKTRANARACAKLSCKVLAVLNPGAKIVAQRYAGGQRVNGSDRWIVFRFRGQDANIHSSVVSRIRRLSEPSPTAGSIHFLATPEGQNEVFYVAADAEARSCALMLCGVAELLPLGARITALSYTRGQWINGSDRWIRFYRDGRHVYVHSGNLTRTQPGFAALPTEQAPDLQGADTESGEIYYLKTRARARECPRLDCDIADAFEKGTKIEAAGYLRGERINNNGRWIAFRHNGRNLYFHSDLLTRQPPPVSATEQPTATTRRIAAKPTAEGENEVFYVTSDARARTCAQMICSEAELLSPGMRIIALRYMEGQEIDGSDRWIRFINQGWFQYVHSSFLSREKPTVEATAQTSATPQSKRDEQAAAESGQVYVVLKPIWAHSCASHRCEAVQHLNEGDRIKVLDTGAPEASYRGFGWAAFASGDQILYVLRSLLREAAHDGEPTAALSPDRRASRSAKGAVFYVRSGRNAKVRSCASLECFEVGELTQGTRVEANRIVRGQTIGVRNEWIEFFYEGGYRYVHSGDLFPVNSGLAFDPTSTATEMRAVTEPPPTATEPPPSATSTATEPPPPTATATVPPAAKYVVETAGNVNANIRSCPRTSCDIVAKLSPGTEVEIVGSVRGETVYDTDVWLEIRLEGASAFIHSELVAEAG